MRLPIDDWEEKKNLHPHQAPPEKKMKKIKKASNREEGDKKGKLIISKCLFHKKKVFLS